MYCEHCGVRLTDEGQHPDSGDKRPFACRKRLSGNAKSWEEESPTRDDSQTRDF